jgi:trehalose 6-phosphate synthase
VGIGYDDWMPETPETLRERLRAKLGEHKFVVVSNREPYMHVYRDGQVDWVRPASGVTVALDPLMKVSRGVWIAHGSGEADREVADEKGYVDVPPSNPSYRLKRIWLTRQQEEDYYYGFANSALWPLCHAAYRRPLFRREHWEAYVEVNALFADSIAEEIGDEPAFLFIQDYHFALLPRMMRERCPNALIVQFWHIPWPPPQIFRICPWGLELLEGMLGSDILGFHVRYHCQDFIDTVDRELEARPDREMTAIVYRGHTTKIRAFPISVDFEDISQRAAAPETAKLAQTLRQRLRIPRDAIIGIGADRLDYTKGIPERLDGLDLFLKRYPQYQGKLVFIQAGAPTRTHVEEYRRLNEEVERRVDALNWAYGRANWRPVIFLQEHVPLDQLVALYQISRFLIVSSLHDGMNLVAKEFVASQNDCTGVLLLSRFTGAARELKDALLINPFSADDVAEQIRRAIEMEPDEVQRRMARMRERVRENNIFRWAATILKKVSRLT